jgi:hypothetical protein
MLLPDPTGMPNHRVNFVMAKLTTRKEAQVMDLEEKHKQWKEI